jgi:ribonucleotide monophosphatase NagD (HAD superfamily)
MRIEGLREIAGQFDGMLIDQFGVIHDGRELYPGTLRVLSELNGAGIPVAVMTNSGKRAEANRQRLVKMGVPREHFADCVSSGEVAYRMLLSSSVPSVDGKNEPSSALRLPSHMSQRATGEGRHNAGAACGEGSTGHESLPPFAGWGKVAGRPDGGLLAPQRGEVLRAFLVGRDGDDYGFEGIDFADDPSDADIILILGSNAPATSLDQYRKMFTGLTLPAICCNPDKLMLTPQGLQPAPGAIAALYEEMGGQVAWIGKPYPGIYTHAARLVGNPKRILCIGDSAGHDVAGGRNAGHATLLVMTGVSHGLDHASLDPQPDYWMTSFTW